MLNARILYPSAFASVIIPLMPKKGNPGTTTKPLNRSLSAAKATKQDEFYTQLSGIERNWVLPTFEWVMGGRITWRDA
jgi:hypothetical protein